MIWIFINLDGQLSNYSNQENEIFPDRKCHGCCHSPTASRWAGDKGCRRSHSFSLRAAALLLLCCCSEVKPPDFSHSPEGAWWEAVSFLSPQHPLPSPLLRKWCLYPCQKTAALYHKMCVFFLWLSQRLLNPSTCIDPPPISPPSLSRSLIPHCFLVWNNIACLLLLIPEDWAPVSAPLSLVLY